MTLISLMPALPEIFLALVILSLLLFGVLQKNNTEEQHFKTANMVTWLVTLSLCLLIFMELYTQNSQITTFENMFINDKFAVYCKVLILIGSLAILIISRCGGVMWAVEVKCRIRFIVLLWMFTDIFSFSNS